jgi:hypothetical protein
MRLEILARESNLVCYFILAGFAKKISPLLQNTHFGNAVPIPPLITTLGSTKLHLDLSKLPEPIKHLLNGRMAKYPLAKFSEIISCDLPHHYPHDIINMSFQTYVWKVNPYLKSRKTSLL